MVPDIKKRTIGRGAAFIYIETLTSLISGYIFWLVVSRITTSEIIGTSSSLVSFAGIIAVISGLGIPTGIQRFLGKSFIDKDFSRARVFFNISLFIVFLGIAVCIFMILIVHDWIRITLGFDLSLVLIMVLLIASTNLTMLLRSTIISSLNTQSLPIIFIISSLSKLVLTVVLLTFGTGSLGLTFGFTFSHVLSSVLLSILVYTNVFKSSAVKNSIEDFIVNSKKIILASSVNWIPTLILTLGTQLGTLVVFGTHGADKAAVYFLALTIVTGITSVMYSLFTIALPTLSGLSDKRKRITWQTIRLSTIVLLPFSCSLIFYSKEIMQLLGNVYVEGSLSLQILLLSMLPMCVLGGINTLMYSYGNYRNVLVIGLAVSLPQTILYFMLVPAYQGIGAATGYTLGSIIGCAVSVIIAKKTGLLLFWKDLAILFILSTSIGYVLSSLNVHYIAGVIGTILLTYVLTLKIHIVTGSDVQDFLDILPERLSISLTKVINKYKKN